MAAKHVASRALLDHIARRLLVRLFEPHAAFFAAHGLALADLAATAQNDRALLHRAYDILRDHADVAPDDLCAILSAIEALANTAGQAAVYKACPELSALRLGPQDAAATAALDYPEAFARLKRVAEPAAASQTDYDAVSNRAPLVSDDAFAALKDAIVPWLVKHGRTETYVLHKRDHDGVLHVEIEHGRPPITADVIGEKLDLTTTTLSTTERSHFLFDRAKSRLSVQASHAAIKELLRRLVGEHLFGNPDRFRRDAAYSLDPLKENLDAALAFKDIPGLKSVTLIGIEIEAQQLRDRKDSRDSSDLRETKLAHQLRELLTEGKVTWCKLRIEIAGRNRPCILEIAPAQKKLPRSAADIESIIDEWLIARGILVVRERRGVVEAMDDVAASGATATTTEDKSADSSAMA